MTARRHCDVLIVGGGLAGLTLALQLRTRMPELEIVVIERARFPVPSAAHKVGESTVEIGAHYFANQLGLGDHLRRCQLRKFGLRLFFGGTRPADDLARFDEIGVSNYMAVPSYQIDRGIFENHLAGTARSLGIVLLDNCVAGSAQIEPRQHRVTVHDGERESLIRAKWLVDASGRRAFLRRRLQLSRDTTHRNCSVWYRTSARVDVDTWGSGAQWRARCGGRSRLYSTNHFMGPGYWFWVIPLSSGATSLGLVFDPSVVEFESVNDHAKLLGWLARHQPLVVEKLGELDGELMDFQRLRGYSHDCRRIFSPDRWALTGDAGVFHDPLYSPGSDFIAINNTLITRLIERSVNGRSETETARYQQYYASFFSSTLSLFTGQYPGFGDRELMFAKTVWDYAFYWSVLAKLYFSDRICDIEFIDANIDTLLEAQRLNRNVQKHFAASGASRRQLPAEGRFLDQYKVRLLTELNRQLLADDRDTAVALRENVGRLRDVAHGVHELMAEGSGDSALRAATGFVN